MNCNEGTSRTVSGDLINYIERTWVHPAVGIGGGVWSLYHRNQYRRPYYCWVFLGRNDGSGAPSPTIIRRRRLDPDSATREGSSKGRHSADNDQNPHRQWQNDFPQMILLLSKINRCWSYRWLTQQTNEECTLAIMRLTKTVSINLPLLSWLLSDLELSWIDKLKKYYRDVWLASLLWFPIFLTCTGYEGGGGPRFCSLPSWIFSINPKRRHVSTRTFHQLDVFLFEEDCG